MTSRFQNFARVVAIAGLATVLGAAGQFPVAPSTAASLIARDDRPITTLAVTDPMPTADSNADDGTAPRPAQLSQLVAETIASGTAADADRTCLARAVYFEARGEPLEGQLAVAQVILNRVASGRFADTVCGVINQRGQFSFNRKRVPADGHDWATAKAIAVIAADARWDAMAPEATAFHATRIAASWTTMHKVGTIGNHVFYR